MSSAEPTTLVNAKSWWRSTERAVRRIARAALTAALLALAIPTAAHAADEMALLERVDAYLSRITTLQSRFTQVNPDGSSVEGTVSFHRPGRMRFDYEPPSPLLMVADGRFFISVNKRLQQVAYIPLSRTPLAFLLEPQVRLQEKSRIANVRRGQGVLRIEAYPLDPGTPGFVELTFAENPLVLRQWTVTDAQGLKTTVTFQTLRTGLSLDPKLFFFSNPWANQRRDSR